MKQYITRLILLAFFAVTTAGAFAADDSQWQKGRQLYTKNEFRAAAAQFEELSKAVRSSDVYYNLGNCYYRLNDFPKARLAYERAVRINPSNGDAKYNLRITVAKIKASGAQPKSFISSWAHSFLYWRNISQWAFYSIVAFGLALVFGLVYYFGGRLWIRKSAFFVSAISLLFFLLFMICAGVQTYNGESPNEAIVLRQAGVRQSPSANSKTLQQILPGAKIRLTRGTAVKGWRQISLSGGQKGWISTNDIGEI